MSPGFRPYERLLQQAQRRQNQLLYFIDLAWRRQVLCALLTHFSNVFEADAESNCCRFPERTLKALWKAFLARPLGKALNLRSSRVTQTAFATYLLATIVIAALSNVLLAQNLYIIEKDDLYGFADKSGALLISPKYGLAKAFREGLAPVYVSGRWGYIDSEGNMKIEPQFWEGWHRLNPTRDGCLSIPAESQ